MEILQEIGSYAGLAAVLGLAVLSVLYFSQARDVKRLREWAGRAPERAPEATGVQGVTAKPVTAKPVPRAPGQAAPGAPAAARPPATPGAKPVPPAPAGARAAAAGAAPATAVGPAAATPAARADAAAKAGEGQEAGAPRTGNGTDDTSALSQDTAVHPPPPPPGEDDEDELEEDFDDTGDQDQVSEEDDALDDDGDWEDTGERDGPDPEAHWDDTGDEPAVALRPVTPAASRPIAPGAPVPAAGTPAPSPAKAPAASAGSSGGGSILPPYAHSRPGGRAADGGNGQGVFGSRGRAIALVAAGALVLGGLVLGATQLLGGDEEPAGSGGGSSQNAQNATTGQGGDDQADRQRRPNPRNVRVAVLNGTTVPGLAAQIGDQIERQGFRLGTVTNFNDQQRAESVVLYAPGAEREAAEVGRRLKIAQREPIDAESQGVAGDATVAVVTGQDKTQ